MLTILEVGDLVTWYGNSGQRIRGYAGVVVKVRGESYDIAFTDRLGVNCDASELTVRTV